MGTVVFPDAELKIYLTASAEEVSSAMQEQRAEIEALSEEARKLNKIARKLRENVEQFRI
jgi:methyl-accepting chemotaxis protein